MNLFTSIESVAHARGAALAFDCAEHGQFSYADVLTCSANFAAALNAAGVGAGDRVAVQLDKHIDVVWLYLAVLRQGAVYVPLNTGYTDAELGYFIDDARPRLVVVNAERAKFVRELNDVRVVTLDDLREHAPAGGAVASA